MTSVTYKSKKDTWLMMVIYGSVLAALAASVTLVVSGSPADLLIAVSLFAAGVIFPIWLVRTTYYVLDDQQLIVRSGPFRWSILLARIDSVKRSRNILSSPALSLDRVQIRYDHFRFVLISPEDRDRFLAELENRRSRVAQGI